MGKKKEQAIRREVLERVLGLTAPFTYGLHSKKTMMFIRPTAVHKLAKQMGIDDLDSP